MALGFIIQRRLSHPSGVAGMNRNGWPDLDRNRWPECVGIRTEVEKRVRMELL